MTKPVLLAGVLGGVLGAAFAFSLSRAFPAVAPPPPPPPPSEARRFADDMIDKLKTGKNDQFMATARAAYLEMPDEQFNQWRQQLLAFREGAAKAYGPTSEFEFVRETAIGSAVVRLAYLEKFPRGCVVWVVACYNSPEGWMLLAFHHLKLEFAFDQLR